MGMTVWEVISAAIVPLAILRGFALIMAALLLKEFGLI